MYVSTCIHVCAQEYVCIYIYIYAWNGIWIHAAVLQDIARKSYACVCFIDKLMNSLLSAQNMLSLSLSQIKHKYCSIVGSFFEKKCKIHVLGIWCLNKPILCRFSLWGDGWGGSFPEAASTKVDDHHACQAAFSAQEVQGFWWWGMVLQHALAPAFLGRTLHYSCIGMHTLFFSSTNTILWLHVRFTWFITNIPSPEIPNPNKKNYHDSFVIWCPFAPSLLPQLSLDNYIYTCCFTKCNEFTNYFFI